MPTITAADLEDFARRLLLAGGVQPEDADRVAEALVGANLRGYDSHGVMRIPQYLQLVAAGDVVSGAELEVLSETPALIAADAHWGFGQTQAQRLQELLAVKAKDGGVAIGTLRQCGHIGRLGDYCDAACREGMVSMVMVNSHGAARRVAPPGGKAPRLGTNPLAIGVPCEGGDLVLDFSTSATAEGKVRVKRIAGELCPDGWLLDADGRPTNDPQSLYADPPGTIRPFGGDQAYKGFGLSLMIDIFTGALSGGLCSREKKITPLGNCVFMMLVNPALFGGAEHFAREVRDLDAWVRGCPTIEGVDAITLPGDPERAVLAQRQSSGIPFDEQNWAALLKLAEELDVASEISGT